MQLASEIKKLLSTSTQPLTASQIVRLLTDQGLTDITKTKVNSYLYMGECNGTVRKTEIPGVRAPGWILVKNSPQLNPTDRDQPLVPQIQTVDSRPDLYRWQKEALTAWEKQKNKGMVEAVTGSGKTRLAFAAWIELQKKVKPLNTLVVVP